MLYFHTTTKIIIIKIIVISFVLKNEFDCDSFQNTLDVVQSDFLQGHIHPFLVLPRFLFLRGLCGEIT